MCRRLICTFHRLVCLLYVSNMCSVIYKERPDILESVAADRSGCKSLWTCTRQVHLDTGRIYITILSLWFCFLNNTIRSLRCDWSAWVLINDWREKLMAYCSPGTEWWSEASVVMKLWEFNTPSSQNTARDCAHTDVYTPTLQTLHTHTHRLKF